MIVLDKFLNGAVLQVVRQSFRKSHGSHANIRGGAVLTLTDGAVKPVDDINFLERGGRGQAIVFENEALCFCRFVVDDEADFSCWISGLDVPGDDLT